MGCVGAWAFMPLTNGDHTLLDSSDYEDLHPGRWYRTKFGYAAWKRKTLIGVLDDWLHRVIMRLMPWDKMEVDHINGDRLDNRRCNLRVVTRAQNCQNKPSLGGSSKYRGVHWCKRTKRWMARAKLNQKTYYLGSYEDEEDAADAASKFREEHMPFSEEGRRAA